MGKRFVSTLLIMVLLIVMLANTPLSAFAASSGKCGDNVYYSLNNGVLTISGSGNMYDYHYLPYTAATNRPLWSSVQQRIQKVIIEDGVTSVGEYAFYKCTNASEAIIGEDTISLGDFSFAGCVALSRINIYGSLVSIGNNAFGSCMALQSIDIPRNVTQIGT